MVSAAACVSKLLAVTSPGGPTHSAGGGSADEGLMRWHSCGRARAVRLASWAAALLTAVQEVGQGMAAVLGGVMEGTSSMWVTTPVHQGNMRRRQDSMDGLCQQVGLDQGQVYWLPGKDSQEHTKLSRTARWFRPT